MKILFFGTSEFAVPALEAVAARHDVAGVVTQPDRPAGRGQKLVATPVKRAALARGLRVFEPERLKPFVDEARALGADAFVVASYGRIVPQALLDVVPVAFNVHPSVLPLYRGATPLQSAIRDGRTETGVTIIAMDAGMDTGDVLLQERTPLGASETYGELHDRLAALGAGMLVDALERQERGTLARTPQKQVAAELGIGEDEIAKTATRPLSKADAIIDWDALTAKQAVDFVRSLSPVPGARTFDDRGQPLRILSAHQASRSEYDPSILVRDEDGKLVVSECKGSRDHGVALDRGDAYVVFDRVVPAGKDVMTASQFAHMLAQQFARGSKDVAT